MAAKKRLPAANVVPINRSNSKDRPSVRADILAWIEQHIPANGKLLVSEVCAATNYSPLQVRNAIAGLRYKSQNNPTAISIQPLERGVSYSVTRPTAAKVKRSGTAESPTVAVSAKPLAAHEPAESAPDLSAPTFYEVGRMADGTMLVEGAGGRLYKLTPVSNE